MSPLTGRAAGPRPELSRALCLGLRRRGGGARARPGSRSSRWPGPRPATSPASTSSCRWSPGAITCDYPRWLALLDRAEAERWPMLNPPALLRWNSDKAYLRGAGRQGHPDGPDGRRSTALDDAVAALARAAKFGAIDLVIKPPVSARRRRHLPASATTTRSRPTSRGQRDAGPAVPAVDRARANSR